LPGSGEIRLIESGNVTFLGAVVRLKVRLGDRTLLVDAFNAGAAALPRRGETVELGLCRDDVIVLDGG